ncbi:class I SAM-dependent methyltransferase [Janibacter cremeus]|uniref:class I SAM-dependent methyltransferase n=1 Tax=Janibacter cremeus TaxID=1285192 RepID=UPI0023F82E99|nr:class I SAM-dependent methyltransferase [Janibacter cremeus]WEV76612.1 class I SAM-dependent methyltransferase [Janibacter cremeus]
MDLTTVRWLASPEGHAALHDLPEYREADAVAQVSALRAEGRSAEQAAALMTQKRLRARAQDKFGEFAQGMLFTPDGLEQASRLEVAATHAGRYAAASLATVHDLGCGIGSDAMAMSALGVTVQAIDADPLTAALADINLRPWPDSRARTGLAEDFDPPLDPLHARAGVWLDPARRTPGVADRSGRTRRVFRLDEISPSWDFVLSVARDVPATGAKLSPSLPHDIPPLGTEAQWLSWQGTVLECTVWWGPLVKETGRSARVLRRDRPPVEVDERSCEDDPRRAAALADTGRWLYEADRAVVRAGLIGTVTGAVSGAELEPGLGYVTSDLEIDLGHARRFEVLEAMPFSVKALRAWLREHGITGLTIKKRGIRLDEDQLRRQLKIGRGAGDGASATIVLTRVAGAQSVLVVSPCD